MTSTQRRAHAVAWWVVVALLAGSVGYALLDRPSTPVVAEP